MSLSDTYNMWIVVFFVLGYFFITIEHIVHVNKANVAILMGVICWTLHFANHSIPHEHSIAHFGEHIFDISQVIFFLLGALAIVEIISVHQGFNLISDLIRVKSKRQLLWVLGVVTFFLSAVLDNLTTTIVMLTLLRKLTGDKQDRLILGGSVVIAANAGGAWTPIGDVTTTMLWIGGQLTTKAIIANLFLPSVTCMVASFAILHFMLEGNMKLNQAPSTVKTKLEPFGHLLFFLGIGALIFVPIFKLLTGLPPFMGMLFGLAVLWLVTDILHAKFDDRQHLRVPQIMTRVDLSGVLFFLGILLVIDAMEAAGILDGLAHWLSQKVASPNVIAVMIGVASAIVDNVPLVAAAMGMYELTTFPPDDQFWQLIALCAGTGGSILIIGSAAGVVFMGMERVDFISYVRKISLAALVGYFAGIAVYLLF